MGFLENMPETSQKHPRIAYEYPRATDISTLVKYPVDIPTMTSVYLGT